MKKLCLLSSLKLKPAQLECLEPTLQECAFLPPLPQGLDGAEPLLYLQPWPSSEPAPEREAGAQAVMSGLFSGPGEDPDPILSPKASTHINTHTSPTCTSLVKDLGIYLSPKMPPRWKGHPKQG